MKPIRWYHWAIYRLYRWAWNPILRERPLMAYALGRHISAGSGCNAEDEAAIDALVKRRVGKLEVHRLAPEVKP